MRKRRIILLFLIWLFAGCSDASNRPLQVQPGDIFTLQQGQEAVVGGEDLHLRFDSVLEDSRCPTQVECFWSGQARIAVLVWQEQNADNPEILEFNTNPAPGENVQIVTYSSYTIRLESLDPYPASPDEAIEQDAYRATLQIGT